MMPLHTPLSIWAKYRQPSLEIASDGFGVCLGENTYLYIRWSAGLPSEEATRWCAFFARLVCDPAEIDELAGIEPTGASSQVISLAELKAGLALLTSFRVG